MNFDFVYDVMRAIAYLLIGVAIGVSIMIHERILAHQTVPTLVDLPKIQPKAARATRSKKPDLGTKIRASAATPVRIALIDTGYDPSIIPDGVEKLKICPEGSYDFISEKPGVAAAHWHGSVTGSLIAEGLKDVDYCVLVYQVATFTGGIPDEALIAALKRASGEHLTALNMSLGGLTYSADVEAALRAISSQGVAVFVAAGNDAHDFNVMCNTYPACYKIPGMYTVGAVDEGYLKASYSNYGERVDAWYLGTVEFAGNRLQGTSFSSPRALADHVRAFRTP